MRARRDRPALRFCHHNSKLASRRRQHRDDAIGDPGPRRLPLGRRCGFATRGRQANSRATTRDCGQRTTAAVLRSCTAVSSLSSSAPLKGSSASAFRYGVWEARCARPTFKYLPLHNNRLTVSHAIARVSRVNSFTREHEGCHTLSVAIERRVDW